MPELKQKEYLKRNLKTKEVYHFIDEKEGYDVISREVYKNKALEIHHPFDKRDGSQKYKYIENIEFHGVSPKSIRGVLKTSSTGLGLTGDTSPMIARLEKIPRISKIIISDRLSSKIDANKLVINTTDFEEIYQLLRPFRQGQRDELKVVTNNLLSDIFPARIKKTPQKYSPGSLSIFIRDKSISGQDLSSKDTESLVGILPEHIAEEKILYKTEERINLIKLNRVKESFRKLISQKTDTSTLENKCQKFFEKNSWIFSNILSIPVALLDGKAYVGGKTIENKSGKEADFLYRSNLTKNIFIIEIKTPKKKLVDVKTPYRKPDVFPLGKELTGGLVQVLDQKDSLQKDFYSLTRDKDYQSFNPRALLVIGLVKDLTKNQLKSFELFRNNLRDVEIVTYDELLDRTELVLSQFVDDESTK